MLSKTEENYLKAIYNLGEKTQTSVSTNQIAEKLQTKASSVTDMLKKLATKSLVDYAKYQGVSLTKKGKKSALLIIRKHRLWEVFLAEKLLFKWDEIHEVAEQLEHIKSDELMERLDAFLEFPTHDPHGDPIPDKNGNIDLVKRASLADCKVNDQCVLVGVKNTDDSFLKYLNKQEIAIGEHIEVLHIESYDHSVKIKTSKNTLVLTEKVANNLLIKKQ